MRKAGYIHVRRGTAPLPEDKVGEGSVIEDKVEGSGGAELEPDDIPF